MQCFSLKLSRNHALIVVKCAQMSKTIIAVSHFGLGGRKSLETAVNFEFYSIFSKFVIFFGEGTNDTPPLLRP